MGDLGNCDEVKDDDAASDDSGLMFSDEGNESEKSDDSKELEIV